VQHFRGKNEEEDVTSDRQAYIARDMTIDLEGVGDEVLYVFM
jgi:hypothetical protein